MDRKMTTSDLRIKVFGDGAGGAAGGGAGGAAGAAAAASGGGAGGNAGGPWYSALPEDIRADPSITKYGDIETFARGHLAQSKLIGKPADRLLELPGAVPSGAVSLYPSTFSGAPRRRSTSRWRSPTPRSRI